MMRNWLPIPGRSGKIIRILGCEVPALEAIDWSLRYDVQSRQEIYVKASNSISQAGLGGLLHANEADIAARR